MIEGDKASKIAKDCSPFTTEVSANVTLILNLFVTLDGVMEKVYVNPLSVEERADAVDVALTEKSDATVVVAPEFEDTVMRHAIGERILAGLVPVHVTPVVEELGLP